MDGDSIQKIIDIAKSKNKRKDSVFVINQYFPEISRLDASKAERRSGRKTNRENSGRDIRAERHKSCWPSYLDSSFF